MVEQRDIKFPVEGGDCLRGWLFFPDELYQAPRSWAEKAYPKLILYNKLAKGGHFAAWEQPETFVSEMRASFKMLRKPI
jgi:hypothetical protein